jgi:hypothetical protein
MPGENVSRDGADYTVNISPAWSEGWATFDIGLTIALAVVSALGALKHYWRATRLEKLGAQVKGLSLRDLSPGKVTLYGVPEAENPGAVMVATTITQVAESSGTPKSPQHVWKEVKRSTEANPFWLVLPSEEKLRVLPDEAHVVLLDEIDETKYLKRDVRQSTAKLSPGEPLFISGELAWEMDPAREGSYREPGRALVLRAAKREPMIITSMSLGGPHRRRSLYHIKWVLGLLGALLFLRVILFGGYYSSKNNGHVVWFDDAVVDTFERYHKPKSGAGYYATHYTVEVSYTDEAGRSFTLKSETEKEIYVDVNMGRAVPFWVVPSAPDVSEVGIGATLSFSFWFFMSQLALLVLVAVYFSVLIERPWYWRKKFNQHVSGALPFTPTT